MTTTKRIDLRQDLMALLLDTESYAGTQHAERAVTALTSEEDLELALLAAVHHMVEAINAAYWDGQENA